MLTRRGFLNLIAVGVLVIGAGQTAATSEDGAKTAKVTLAIHGMT
jgi:hypothetical protein